MRGSTKLQFSLVAKLLLFLVPDHSVQYQFPDDSFERVKRRHGAKYIPISPGLFPVMQVVSRKLIRGVHTREFTSGSGFSTLTIYPALRRGEKEEEGGGKVRGLRESGLPEVPVRPSRSGPISTKFDHVVIRGTIRDDSAVMAYLLGMPILIIFFSFSRLRIRKEKRHLAAAARR